ncbi:hypothetical protein BVX95_00895 [archaeon D22]|nr:hypothetical protein BVX95_00895 [archaeon D22]
MIKVNKLAGIIDGLSLEELRLVKKDLDCGNIERLINNKILEVERGGKFKICPVCNTDIVEGEELVLYFGPQGLRKKASFCANDCLEYFLHRQRQIMRNQNGTC